MPGTITSLGGIALLVSGLTGPSIAVIPLLFQQAGWLTPFIAFTLITVLTGAAALFLVESMASILGNERFQASIEFSTIAELYLGHRWHWALQVILYVALQSQTVTSLIESFQSMDSLLVTIAHKSCAISFQKGWECVDSTLSNGSGVFSDYIFISFGYLITFVMVLPLGLIQLGDNIKFQIASLVTLFFIIIVWIVTFFQTGITNHPVPAVGSDQSTVVGYVISNFAFVTTIPAFVNNIHPSTNVHRVVWISLVISCAIYISIGITGASAFNLPPNSTILDVISGRRPSTVALVSTYLFPPAVLITSIPVFMIVIRYNLLRGNICSKPWAIFWSSIFPWIIVIPFQTSGWLMIIMNWTSLLFSSVANLVIPFILYLASKHYNATAILDQQREQDEFRLRPLETTSLETSPLPRNRHSRSRSAITSRSYSLSPTVDRQPASPAATTPKIEKIAYFKDSGPSSPAPLDDNVIRLIRSPSIHRHYGETAEGSSASHVPRKRSISKTTTPPSAVIADEDKVDMKVYSNGSWVEVEPASIQPALSFADDVQDAVGNFDHSSLPTTAMKTSDDEGDIATKGSLTRPTSRNVPVIKIVTAESTHRMRSGSLSSWGGGFSPDGGRLSPGRGDAERASFSSLSRTSVHMPSPSLEHTRQRSIARGLSSPQELGDFPLPSIGGEQSEEREDISARLNSVRRIVSPSPSSSLGTSEDSLRRRTFEAFPWLNRTRWFKSTNLAILFCVITTIMIAATIIYNIVLATHTSGQITS